MDAQAFLVSSSFLESQTKIFLIKSLAYEGTVTLKNNNNVPEIVFTLFDSLSNVSAFQSLTGKETC